MRLSVWMILVGLLMLLTPGFYQVSPAQDVKISRQEQQHWVDSVYAAMSLDERIGQLFMLRAHSNKGSSHEAFVERMIRDYHVGGVLFFQGTPRKQAELTNRYQQAAGDVPLWVAMDAEWGLGMRLKESTISFPYQIMLGAIRDNRLLYDMGEEVARQCRRLGVHMNFAPVVDVNNNPANPVINFRSFGEDRYNVAVKGYMYMKGMEDNGLIACAKHFPGHGDTDTDSHYDLPVITHTRERLDSIELFPFKVLAERGIGSMMIAHLQVPALDSTENTPTTLSRPTVQELLREEIGFEGIIVTDALDMAGATKHHEPGEIEAKALRAGNDLLLLPLSVPKAVEQIKEYLRYGRVSTRSLEASVKRILGAKYRLGLTRPQSVELEKLEEDLNDPKALALKRKLIQHSMTLVRNREQLLPLRRLDTLEIASLSIGAEGKTVFQQRLGDYDAIDDFQISWTPSSRDKSLLKALAEKDLVIVGLHNMSMYERDNFGITEGGLRFLTQLKQRSRVVLVVFGNPYALRFFDNYDWVLQAYSEDPYAQDIAAQSLMGVYDINGRLPVTASPESRFNDGLAVNRLFRLGYGLPEEVGLSSRKMKKIDTIAMHAVDSGATPGCVVLVAKDGKIVFEKAYGHHTYDGRQPVSADDLYDLASVTKILAGTMAIMKLEEEGKVDLYAPLKTYLPELDTTNKAELTLYDMMTHQARLRPWIPFYLETLTSRNRPMKEFYRKITDVGFSYPVADRLYLRDNYQDSIWQKIYGSELLEKKEYRYSDLGFILIARVVERVSGKPLHLFLQEAFYEELNLHSLTYRPWEKFPLDRIPPTEEDKYFRNQRVKGYVHDMAAAMLGGVSGHAGLFGAARDVAVPLQMLLNGGYYGGKKYLQKATIDQYTRRCEDCPRRGIGFDMKQIDPDVVPNMSEWASKSTYGHLGFTGIAAWVDPDQNLIYLFLSNRTYPTMDNKLLGKMDIRPRIQSVIYQAMDYGMAGLQTKR